MAAHYLWHQTFPTPFTGCSGIPGSKLGMCATTEDGSGPIQPLSHDPETKQIGCCQQVKRCLAENGNGIANRCGLRVACERVLGTLPQFLCKLSPPHPLSLDHWLLLPHAVCRQHAQTPPVHSKPLHLPGHNLFLLRESFLVSSTELPEELL